MSFELYHIDIKGRTSGQFKTKCPKCSDKRTNKTDKSLSVDVTNQVWHCHYCGWSGSLNERKEDIKYQLPVWKNETNLPDAVLKYFEGRRISAETLLKMNITSQVEYMPQIEKKVSVICFNYFFGGKLVNVKYRDAAKNFKLHKGAELILYNLDSVIAAEDVWITEGEMDALSLIEAGIYNVVSVPNGANENTQYLDRYMELFDSVKRIHLCVDNDTKGRELRETLADRFGKERCDYVVFQGYKDANEYLIAEGKIKLREAAYNFTEFPLLGVFTIKDIQDDIYDLYQNGLPQGVDTGMNGFDRLLKFHKGYLTTITGIPGHGKSDFLDHILIKLNTRHGWKGAFYSPENRPTQLHFSKLARKITMRPWYGEHRMNESELQSAMFFLDETVYFIKPENDFTLDSILSHVKLLRNRKGIDYFVIDAWNKLEHQHSESETKYIGQSLDKLVNFCERNNVHCFLVAHPTKIRKDNGFYEVPNLYDIAGSANFFNKTDNGITVYRDMRNDIVEVHVQKVKFSHWGEIGMQKFNYDKTTGLYLETL
jgi:twinkle protein